MERDVEDMIWIIKEILFWWMLIYGILLIFSRTIRISFIKWLKSLDNDKVYSLKAIFKLDKEYKQDEVIVEIKRGDR